jgi:O-antigen/teichoic acid export membrane protein
MSYTRAPDQAGQDAVRSEEIARHTRGLHGKVLVSGAIKAVQLALGVGASLLLARWLGAAGYGAYSFALALATLLAIPAQLGWPTLLTREVARAQHEGDLSRLRGVLTTSSRWTFFSSLALVVVGLLIVAWVATSRNGLDTAALLIGCALIPPMAWIGLRAAALRGMDRVIVAQVLDGILRPALFLLLVAGAFTWGRLSPAIALVAQVVAVVGSVAFGSIVLARVLPAGLHRVAPITRDVVAWRRSLWPLMFVSAAQIVTSQADLFVLGLVSNPRTVGVYKVAVMIGTQVGFATWLVNAVSAPRIVKLHRAGLHIELRDALSQGMRYVLMVAVPIALGIVVLGKPILGLALGPEYDGAYWPMSVVAIGQLIGVSAGPVGMVLGMTGHERDVAKALAVSAIVSVLLTVALAFAYGALGAAVATACGLVLSRILLRASAYRAIPEIRQ